MKTGTKDLKDYKALTIEAALKLSIPISEESGRELCRLVPVGQWILKRPQLIEKINRWRNTNLRFYMKQNQVSIDDTHNFIFDKIHGNSRSLLFLIRNDQDNYVGQISYSNFEIDTVQLDNLVLGEKSNSINLMNLIELQSVAWVKQNFGVKTVKTYVLSYNVLAIELHRMSNFVFHEEFSVKALHSANGKILSICREGDSNCDFKCYLFIA
jgi:hypothetical protein